MKLLFPFLFAVMASGAPTLAVAEDVKIEKGARLFADLCTKQPKEMKTRLMSIIASEYGNNGLVLDSHVTSGAASQAILSYSAPEATNDKRFSCSVHAFRVDRGKAINAWFAAFNQGKPGSWRLTKQSNLAKDELAKWSISGPGRNATLVAQSIKRKGAMLRLSWN